MSSVVALQRVRDRYGRDHCLARRREDQVESIPIVVDLCALPRERRAHDPLVRPQDLEDADFTAILEHPGIPVDIQEEMRVRSGHGGILVLLASRAKGLDTAPNLRTARSRPKPGQEARHAHSDSRHVWKMWRDHPGFSQRATAVFEDGGRTIRWRSELQEGEKPYRPDLEVIYRRRQDR